MHTALRAASMGRVRQGWAATRRIATLSLAGALLLSACLPPAPDPAPAPPTPVVSAPVLPPALGGAATGPVVAGDGPDPFVARVDPSYCAAPPPTTATTTVPTTATTGSGVAGSDTTVSPPPGACYLAYTTQVFLAVHPIWRSTDLVTWTPAGAAMPEVASWVQWGHNWAPSVLERPANPPDARFVMWYTARERASGLQCLGVATAAVPTGPFVDYSSGPAYCQRSQQGTIDADPFLDVDGTPYLVYKSESPARIWVAQLSTDGRSLLPGTERLLLNGGGPDPHAVEAPAMARIADTWFLFYSMDEWWTDRYRVGVARCDSAVGPCSRIYRDAVLASRGSMLGPGGQTPFQDASGAYQMIFHAWTAPLVGYATGGARSMRLLPITVSEGQPRIG